MDNFAAMNKVYAKYFTSEMPARAAYGVVKLPMGALVEIECIAAETKIKTIALYFWRYSKRKF